MTRSARRDSTSRVIPGYLRWSSLLVFLGVYMTSVGWSQLPEKPPFVQPPTKPPVAQPPAKPGVAQPPKTPATKPPVAKTPATKPKQEDKVPEPEAVSLNTKDGWRIHCMYYPPRDKIRSGRETVPIILVHGWGGQGSQWGFLALGLQNLGHAVMVVDLRGHGKSTGWRNPRDTLGVVENFDHEYVLREKLHRDNIWRDIEVVKSELMKKNNAGEVNIEMLTLIAAQEGCIIALDWAVIDWSWQSTAGHKQGRDVKALILLSPVESLRHMRATQALSSVVVREHLALMIAAGAEESNAMSDARKIYDRITRGRRALSRIQREREDALLSTNSRILRLTGDQLSSLIPEDRDEYLARDAFLVPAPTSLQGIALTDRSLRINLAIVTFIARRLLDRSEDLQWTERRSPISN